MHLGDVSVKNCDCGYEQSLVGLVIKEVQQECCVLVDDVFKGCEREDYTNSMLNLRCVVILLVVCNDNMVVP